MTDGVARELEQAEARLAEARNAFLIAVSVSAHANRGSGRRWDTTRAVSNAEKAGEEFMSAAIEVGRLRALAVVETALTGIDAEIALTLAWRANQGMRPATDTSRFAMVPPSGLREIEWHIREARRALAAREELQG